MIDNEANEARLNIFRGWPSPAPGPAPPTPPRWPSWCRTAPAPRARPPRWPTAWRPWVSTPPRAPATPSASTSPRRWSATCPARRPTARFVASQLEAGARLEQVPDTYAADVVVVTGLDYAGVKTTLVPPSTATSVPRPRRRPPRPCPTCPRPPWPARSPSPPRARPADRSAGTVSRHGERRRWSSSRWPATRCRITSPTRCSSPSGARPSSTSSTTTWPSASRSCGRWAAARSCCSASPTAPAASRSSRSGCPPGRPSGSQTTDGQHAQRHHLATPWWPPTWPTWSGRSTWAASASTSGRTRPPTPTTPTSCASTSTRSPGVTFDQVREAACEVKALLRRARASTRVPEDHRQPGPARLRPPRAPLGLLRRCAPPRWPWPASSSGAGPT